jgi:hypothetical protein
MEEDYQSLQATDKGYFMAQYCTTLTAITNIAFNDALGALDMDNEDDAMNIMVDKIPNEQDEGVTFVAINEEDKELFSVKQDTINCRVKISYHG